MHAATKTIPRRFNSAYQPESLEDCSDATDAESRHLEPNELNSDSQRRIEPDEQDLGSRGSCPLGNPEDEWERGGEYDEAEMTTSGEVGQQKTAIRGIRTPTQQKSMIRSTVGNSRTRLVGTNSPLRQSPFASSNAWEGLHQGKGRKRKREDESPEESRPRAVRNVQELTTMFSTKGPRRKKPKKTLQVSHSNDTPRLRLVPNLRLVFRDEQQDLGIAENRYLSVKRQWTDAIDISLAKSTLAMPESRSRGTKHRKPANQGNWHPVQSPTKADAVGKKQNVHHLELETPQSKARKTTVPAPIYEPLRFVSPSEVSKGSVHGKKRSVDRHRINLSSSETSRPKIMLSASRTRSQHPSAGLQRKRLQAVSSPLAFRAVVSLAQQQHIRGYRHRLEACDALDNGEQKWQGSEGPVVERQNITSTKISALATSQSRLPDQRESITIQRSKAGGRMGEAVEVQKSQVKAHQPGSRNRANGDLAGTKTFAPTGLRDHAATCKGPVLETPRLSLQPNQPVSTSHGNGNATPFRKLAGTFRPSSAVLQHPEILLGLLESGESAKEHCTLPIRRAKKTKGGTLSGIDRCQTIADFEMLSKIQKSSHAHIARGPQTGKTQETSGNREMEAPDEGLPLPPLPMVINSLASTRTMVHAPLQPSPWHSTSRFAKPATQKRTLLPFPSRGTSAQKMFGTTAHDALPATSAQSAIDCTSNSPGPMIRMPTLGTVLAKDPTAQKDQADSSSQIVSSSPSSVQHLRPLRNPSTASAKPVKVNEPKELAKGRRLLLVETSNATPRDSLLRHQTEFMQIGNIDSGRRAIANTPKLQRSRTIGLSRSGVGRHAFSSPLKSLR